MAHLPDLGGEFDPKLVELIQLVTALVKPDLWPNAFIADIRKRLSTQYGRVPTLDDLAGRFGEDVVHRIAREFIQERVTSLEHAYEQSGKGSPCHLCQRDRTDADPSYDFGLARDVEKKFNWGAVGILAANVVTMPLGIAVRPSQLSRTSARIARCCLVLCQGCAHSRKGFFGSLKVTMEDCKKHPSWHRLVKSGYLTFYDREKLAEFSARE